MGCMVYTAMHMNTSDVARHDSQALRAIAEPNRRRILQMLRGGDNCCGKQGPGLCECGIRERLSISQPTVSHHLAVLREAGLVRTERRGHWIWYYRIEDKIRRLVHLIRDEV
jgi:ArsR family transcriptional regulator